MTTQYQRFDSYTEGQTVPSDFFESGSSSTDAIFWIINGTMTALAAAAMDGGARGARLTAGNNLEAITQSYDTPAGARNSVSAFVKFPTDGSHTVSATSGTAQLVTAGSLVTIGIRAGHWTVEYGGTVAATGPAVSPDAVYFVQAGAFYATGGGGRAEGNVYQFSGGVWTQILAYDSGNTVTFGGAAGKAASFGILTSYTVGGTSATVTIDFDYVAWSTDLSTYGTYPGYQPPVSVVVTATEAPGEDTMTVTASGSELIDSTGTFGTDYITVTTGIADVGTNPRPKYLNPFLRITIWDKSFAFQQILGDPIYAAITPRWPGVGSAEIQLRANDPANEWLQRAGANITVVYKDYETVFSGPVDSFQGSILVGGVVTYQFTDWYTLLRETLGFVQPGGNITAASLNDEAQTYLPPGTAHVAGAADGVGYYHWPSNIAETAIKSIISANFTRLGRPVNVLPSQGRGGTLTADQLPQVRFDDLQTVCETMATLAGLRIRVWLEPGDTQLTLDVAPVGKYFRALTYESGVLQDGNYSVTSPQATRVIVGGPGEDTARAFYPLANSTDEAAWRPIETFKDSTSGADLIWPTAFTDAQKVPKYYAVETDPAITSAMKAGFNRTLLAAASNVLAATVSKAGVEVRLSETDAWHYGGLDGFAVGDTVTVESGGISLTDSITEVTLNWTSDSFVVTPVVGQRTDDPDVNLLQALRHLATALRSTATER